MGGGVRLSPCGPTTPLPPLDEGKDRTGLEGRSPCSGVALRLPCDDARDGVRGGGGLDPPATRMLGRRPLASFVGDGDRWVAMGLDRLGDGGGRFPFVAVAPGLPGGGTAVDFRSGGGPLRGGAGLPGALLPGRGGTLSTADAGEGAGGGSWFGRGGAGAAGGGAVGLLSSAPCLGGGGAALEVGGGGTGAVERGGVFDPPTGGGPTFRAPPDGGGGTEGNP